MERFGLESPGPGKWSVVGSCEHSNKPTGSINDVEFLDKLTKLLASRKNSVSWSWLYS